MKKILIIDDALDIVEAIQSILESENYQVESSRNFDRIIEDAHKFQPHLIMLDVLLPGIDGRDIAKKIRQSGNGIAKTPILLMSAHADLVNNFRDSGANDFIAKPFEIEEILNKVAALTI